MADDWEVITSPPAPVWVIQKAEAVHVGPGLVLPAAFTVHASRPDDKLGTLSVEIEVEVAKDRARPRRVAVSTDRPSGVSSTTMQAVPIRDLVAVGVRLQMLRVTLLRPADGGRKPLTEVEPITEATDEEIETIRRLVGYVKEVRR